MLVVPDLKSTRDSVSDSAGDSDFLGVLEVPNDEDPTGGGIDYCVRLNDRSFSTCSPGVRLFFKARTFGLECRKGELDLILRSTDLIWVKSFCDDVGD